MLALAMYGDASRASRESDIPERTLRDWRVRHGDRLAAIRRDIARARAADVARVATAMGAKLDKAESTLEAGLEGKASREQLMAARAYFDCLATLVKEVRLDAGEPTEITESREVETLTDAQLDERLNELLADPVVQRAIRAKP